MKTCFKVLFALSLALTAIAAPALAGVPKVVFTDEFGYAT